MKMIKPAHRAGFFILEKSEVLRGIKNRNLAL